MIRLFEGIFLTASANLIRNREFHVDYLGHAHRVFQIARKEMANLARPVLSFLNSMYSSEPVEDIRTRRLVDQLKPAEIKDIAKVDKRDFAENVTKARNTQEETVSIQFTAERAEIPTFRRWL